MRLLFDTNVLVSAALFPGGVAARAFRAAADAGHEMLVPQYCVDELVSVFARKFADRTAVLDRFLEALPSFCHIIEASESDLDGAGAIRDPADWPVWQAALSGWADILVTGDKDLLGAGLSGPSVVTPALLLSLLS